MQLKPEIIRKVMLTLENNIILNDNLEIEDVNIYELNQLLPDFSISDLTYTVLKLDEADYIDAVIEYGDNKITYCDVRNITYEGHEFIESIRNDSVWNEIKKRISAIGSFTIPIIKDLGVTLLKQYLTSTIFPQ